MDREKIQELEDATNSLLKLILSHLPDHHMKLQALYRVGEGAYYINEVLKSVLKEK